MSSSTDDSLDLACAALQNAVQKCHKKKSKRQYKSEEESERRLTAAKTAVARAQFAIRQLTIKRKSLEEGVKVLKDVCWGKCRERLQQQQNSESQAAQQQQITLLLQHVFSNYLRLRDGLVLLTSGECRHEGDVNEMKKNTEFASKLNTQAVRKDGYTKLYSGEEYSGFGWDELFDAEVGILKVELPRALSTTWDKLVDGYGAQAFESFLDQHENQVGQAKDLLEHFREQFVRDLKSLVAGPQGTVRMVTTDKMERLVVTSKNSNVTLERRASDFQVTDSRGVLPNGWTASDWSKAMQLPPMQKTKRVKVSDTTESSSATNVHKRRRVIEDDDSDSDENGEKENAATGLRVRVETSKDEKSSSSLAAIKSKLGVDVEGLEAAREELEAEDAGGDDGETRKHGAIEGSSEIRELEADIRSARTKVERLRRILARVVDKNDDEYEIWDARECLRESSMTLGNHLLTMSSLVDSDGPFSSAKYLEEALDLFRSARDLVKEQEAAHDGMTQRVNDFSEESCMIRRNLLLLLGRAHVNIGIASIELTLVKDGYPKRKSLLSDAVKELGLARGRASAIRSRAVTDRTNGSSVLETALDTKKADELEALACRWLGQAQWHQGKRQEAVRTFDVAQGLFDDGTNSQGTPEPDLVQMLALVGVESYFSSTTLAQLASEAAGRLQVLSRKHERYSEFTNKGEELVGIACGAYRRAASTVASLEELCGQSTSVLSFVDIQEEYSIGSKNDVQAAAEELRSWWDERKAGIDETSSSGPQTYVTGADRPRSDLFASGSSLPGADPTRRFTVGQGRRRRQTGDRGFASARIASTAQALASDNDNIMSENPVRYRKWGDELLPQVTTDAGGTIPKIVYPACAPERPTRGL